MVFVLVSGLGLLSLEPDKELHGKVQVRNRERELPNLVDSRAQAASESGSSADAGGPGRQWELANKNTVGPASEPEYRDL